MAPLSVLRSVRRPAFFPPGLQSRQARRAPRGPPRRRLRWAELPGNCGEFRVETPERVCGPRRFLQIRVGRVWPLVARSFISESPESCSGGTWMSRAALPKERPEESGRCRLRVCATFMIEDRYYGSRYLIRTTSLPRSLNSSSSTNWRASRMPKPPGLIPCSTLVVIWASGSSDGFETAACCSAS
jgi:hypothetical protein